MQKTPISISFFLKFITLLYCFTTTYTSVFSQIKKDLFFNIGMVNPENHVGVMDFSIHKAQYYTDSNKLYFEFEIKDDQLIFDGTNLNSDHVEIWFSAIEKTDILFKYQDENYFGDWGNYLLEPEDTNWFEIKKDYLLNLKHKLEYVDYYNDIDTFFTENIILKKDFFGQTHYGLFKDNAVFFDLENYLSHNVNAKVPEFLFNFFPTDSGYKLKVSFEPKDFLFANNHIIRYQKINIVFFDQDESGLSIHTHSNQYQWGQSKWFKEIELNTPLQINLGENKIGLKQNPKYQYALFYFEDNWKMLECLGEGVSWWDRIVDKYWEEVDVTCDTLINKKDTILIFSTNNQNNYIFFKNYDCWHSTQLTTKYIEDSALYSLKGNKLLFIDKANYIQSKWGYGPCGACDHSSKTIYLLEKNHKKELINFDVNKGNMDTYWPSNFNLKEFDIPDLESIKILKWTNRIFVRVGPPEGKTNKSLTIGFDKNWNPYVVSLVED